MMNLFKKGMIFSTFFLSCLAIALLVASLGTSQWVFARAKRTTNPHESDGKINFGLFHGKKELNVAYGWRTYDIKVTDVLRNEEDFLDYGLWLGTLCCVAIGLGGAVFAAIFSVINTAANCRGGFCGLAGLYLWNVLALLADATSVGQWLAQYFLTLQYNVMMQEDRKNMWTSEGMAELGMSFWFVVGATIISFVNILILYIGTSETREPEPVLPMIEEKTNGAIMLY